MRLASSRQRLVRRIRSEAGAIGPGFAHLADAIPDTAYGPTVRGGALVHGATVLVASDSPRGQERMNLTHDPASNRQRLTLGVEEEFHLVDLATRRLTPRAAEVLECLAGTHRTYAAELQQTVVETNSPVADTLTDLRRDLLGLRAELISAAESLGIGVASAGTMPLCVPLTITETPRFRRMLADYQLLVREQLICGMQVHVGIGDPDVAASLIGRVSRWLPPLLALSASSPFSHRGEDTGYASSRTLIWSRWPTTGRAGMFTSQSEYDALVQDLVASGAISDRGMIYFDVRPSSHVPTIELRICDACPSVDTVVLIAGLFRAVVSRELSGYERGVPAVAVAPPLERAAMWRAARSALEGELVDLAGPRSVPAAVLVRSMVNDLRPELEACGDWECVHELTEASLRGGSAAARQREALRRRGRIVDVVDGIVAETRGRVPASTRTRAPAMLDGYAPPAYDEAVQPDGRPRPAHASLMSGLCAMTGAELSKRVAELERAEVEAGVVFRPTGERSARVYPVDIVPRVLAGEEWSRLQGGVAQRARALDAFLNDIYGEAAIVRDGIVPEGLIGPSPGYQPMAAGILPPGRRRIQVSGFDIVRDGDGRWLVLEDNVRVPSGVAFAIQNRRLMNSVFPELTASADLLDPEQVPALLRRTLAESAPPRVENSDPSIVLLSDGPSDSAFFEHQLLAEAMGIPLVHPADLVVMDDILWHVDPAGNRRVDVVYLRMEDRLAHRRAKNGASLRSGLVRATKAGTLTIANSLGNGIADDKAVYTYVPRFIEYYLGERPLLEQVPTYHCADPDEQAEVLSRLHELVVKPVDGYGGLGVVIGPHASDEELARARSLIEQHPARWIAQDTVSLSTHPSYVEGRFEPRHVDLRVFVYYGAEPVVVPAALTRVAPPGSLIVNSSRGGGAKDTWLLR